LYFLDPRYAGMGSFLCCYAKGLIYVLLILLYRNITGKASRLPLSKKTARNLVSVRDLSPVETQLRAVSLFAAYSLSPEMHA
jgi:hypothetical protein